MFREILIAIFVANVFLELRVDSHVNQTTKNYEKYILNFVISYALIHNEDEILRTILKVIAHERVKAKQEREANAVYWYTRQGRSMQNVKGLRG